MSGLPSVITNIEQVTADWLSCRLFSSNVLAANEMVQQIAVREVKQTAPSFIAFIEVDYTAGCNAPRKLVLKFPQRVPASNREVEFYQHVAALMPRSPTVPCFDAAFDPESGAYHLLMLDVSDTHMMTEYDLSPRRWHIECMIDLLANFHAFWWDHERLGNTIGEFPSQDELHGLVEHVRSNATSFVDFMDDRLSPNRKAALERVLERYSDLLIERCRPQRHMTFVHRDCHAWNFLVPRSPEFGNTYIIDWYSNDDAWRCYPSASDVAFFIAPFWFPERRRMYEIPILQRYHERLIAGGVQDYSWENFFQDYRLFVISCLFQPIVESGSGVTWNWYPQWENAITAFEDHDCRELLG